MDDPPQLRLSRQKGRTDVRKSYSIQFVPSFESDVPLTEKDGNKWLLKMFSAGTERDALVVFENQLREIIACDRPRAIVLNYARTTVKFDHGRPDSVASVKSPKTAVVSVGAVHIAAAKGWCRLTETLLDNGVHWNSDSDVIVDGEVVLRSVTSLHWACAYDRRGVIQTLLRGDGVDVDARDSDKNTPMMYTVRFGHRNVVEILLGHGADVNAANYGDETALVVAARSGRPDIVKYLLDNGAELSDVTMGELSKYDQLNRIDSHGNTALHVACSIGRDDLVAALLRARQRSSAVYVSDYLNVSNDAQQTGLHLATTTGSVAIVGRLRSMGARRDCKDSFGNTPLHLACLEGDLELIGCLLGDDDVDDAVLTLTNRDGWTPVHCAVASDRPDVVRSILDRVKARRRVDQLPVDIDGNTPLHLAARVNSSEKIFIELVEFDPYARNNDGACPLHVAARQSSDDALSAILQTFYSSSSSSSSSSLPRRRHVDIDHATADGESALLICIRGGSVDKVRRLLEYDAGLFPGGPGSMTAMHQLVHLKVNDDRQSRRNVAEIFQLLVDRAVGRWFVDRGMTSAQPTFTANYREAVRCAVDQLARDTTFDGLNVLQYAAKRNAFELLRLVVETSKAYVGSGNTYDVTYLIPETVPSVPKGAEYRDCKSVVEFVVAEGSGDYDAGSLLSLEPFDAVVKPYVAVYRVVQCWILLLHLIDMSLFTWCTLPERGSIFFGDDDVTASLNETESIRNEPYVTSTSYDVSCAAYGVFLVWPLLNFIFDALLLAVHASLSPSHLRAKFIRRQLVNVLLSSMFVVFSSIWCFLYFRSGYGRFYACVLSAIYITGWTYTLTLLRMFRRTSRIVATVVAIFYDDVVPFFVIYAFQLASFSFAFSVLTSSTNAALSDDDVSLSQWPNRTMNLVQVFYSSFSLMLGMDSFGQYLSPMDDDSVYKMVVQMTFVLYESITAIVLLNLLIAMMNKTFSVTIDQVSRDLEADTFRLVGVLMWIERRFSLARGGRRVSSCLGLRRAVGLMLTKNERRNVSGHRVGVPYEIANRWYVCVRPLQDDRLG